MFIKLCGTTNLEDAQLALVNGADALGFIFAPSKRRVTVAQAAAIIRELPAGTETVGVFTDADTTTILAAANTAHLTTVQLHRSYDAAFLDAFAGHTLKLWQVVPYEINPEDSDASEERFIGTLISAFRDERLTAILLDTARAGASGGTGQSFDWQRARTLVEGALALSGRKNPPHLILAGGLNAGNVQEAIRQMKPWGVDAVSGVESVPGRKDPKRVAALIEAARRHP